MGAPTFAIEGCRGLNDREKALMQHVSQRKFIGYGEWLYYEELDDNPPQGRDGDYLVVSYDLMSLHLIYWKEGMWRIKDVSITPDGVEFSGDRVAGGQGRVK